MELLNQIDWAVIAPIIVIDLILIIVALVDLFRRGETNGPKWIWLLVILLISLLGPVIYFIFGRRQQ